MFTKSRNQAGYTLIEIIVALAISAFLGLGVTAFTGQTIRETKRSSYQMQVMQQLENAGFWMSRDVQMSQNVTPGPNAGFPLTLQWMDENHDNFQVTYNITDNQLKRTLVKNYEAPVRTLVAQSINNTPALTNCNYTNGLLTFTATATIGTWSENRTYRIMHRAE